jgi:hypothetical protein
MANEIAARMEEPLTVIARRYDLTFEQFSCIPKLSGEAVPQLHDYLSGLNVKPAGPDVFEYQFHDSPHGPRRIQGGRFTLTIAVPVRCRVDPPLPMEFITLAHLSMSSW